MPRRLTRGLPERTGTGGTIIEPLDEERTLAILDELGGTEIEAIAVCLLWSTVNPAHELRVGELIEQRLPGVPHTLSHAINPVLGEYPRASSTAIDALLKPLMSDHLARLEETLREQGLRGSVLVATSSGALMPAAEVAQAPILSLNSGPSMAPLAGRAQIPEGETAIVADTGGTSYDLSVVRDGEIARTRNTWIGPEYSGHLTGLPSVDIRSIGAGGGSIASVDAAGLLAVGPRSAGAVPGPACYGRGGEEPTVTDAALVLGLIDPSTFLDGTMSLDVEAAEAALGAVARPLGIAVDAAAEAVIALATEQMVQAIDGVAVHQGIDPRAAVLIAGGGAAGLNSVAIGRRLGCSAVIFPETGAALSASGGLVAPLGRDVVGTLPTSTADFDLAAVNRLLSGLEREATAFIASHGGGDSEVQHWAEARYPSQSSSLDLRLPAARFADAADVERLRDAFHATHQRVFAVKDPGSSVEVTGWRVRTIERRSRVIGDLRAPPGAGGQKARVARIPGHEPVSVPVVRLGDLQPEQPLAGPAIVESPSTTIVVDPGATAVRTTGRGLHVIPLGGGS